MAAVVREVHQVEVVRAMMDTIIAVRAEAKVLVHLLNILDALSQEVLLHLIGVVLQEVHLHPIGVVHQEVPHLVQAGVVVRVHHQVAEAAAEEVREEVHHQVVVHVDQDSDIVIW